MGFEKSVKILVMGRTPSTIFSEHRTNSKKLERFHLLVIKLEHHIFGFEQTNIEPN